MRAGSASAGATIPEPAAHRTETRSTRSPGYRPGQVRIAEQGGKRMSNAHEPSDYGAVFHILGAPAVRARAAPYITGGEIDWRGLLGESRRMSGGEALLVRIAHDLWQGGNSVAVWELPRRLDASSFERVVEAL